MPLEVKELSEYLGIKAENLDEFKAGFEKEFIKQSNINEELEPVKKLLGKTFGTLENEIKKVAKGYGVEIDFDAEDFKGKKVTDKLKAVFGEYDNKNKSIISELEKKANSGNDEKVRDLEEKYAKVLGKAKDYESLLGATKTEFEAYKELSSKEKKGIKLDVFKQQAFSKVKFKADIKDIEKEGYLSLIDKNYTFDLDENEKPVILDKQGKRIPNPKVNGSFMDIEEVLQTEAVKNNLFQLNPQNGQNKNQVIVRQNGMDTQPLRKVAQRMG